MRGGKSRKNDKPKVSDFLGWSFSIKGSPSADSGTIIPFNLNRFSLACIKLE
jgi:hypothetical protein